VFSKSVSSESEEESSTDREINNTDLALDEGLAKMTADDFRSKRQKMRSKDLREEVDISESISGDDDVTTAGQLDPDEELVRNELQSGAVPLEPFNMNTEFRRFEITTDGDMTRRVERPEDASASEDDEYWLKEYDEKVKVDGGYAVVKKINNVDMFEGDKDDEESILDALSKIADNLAWGENAKRALNRLRTKEKDHKITIEEMTDLFTRVLNNGVYDIYTFTKEDLLKYIQDRKSGNADNGNDEKEEKTEIVENNTTGEQTTQLDYYQQYYQQYYANAGNPNDTIGTNDRPLY
jgi:hypothetical protein